MIRPAVFALAVFALMPLPLLAQPPCLALGGQIALCAADSPWAQARAIPLGDDFVAYEAAPFYLEASTAWITPAEAGTPDAALAAFEATMAADSAAEGVPLPVRRVRDTIVTDHATIVYDIFVEVDEGEEFPIAVMVLDDGDGWLTLFLSSDSPMDGAAFEEETRSLAGLLRPEPEG